jgi:hypothetical protein
MILMIRFIHNHAVGAVVYKKFIFNNLYYLIAQRVKRYSDITSQS